MNTRFSEAASALTEQMLRQITSYLLINQAFSQEINYTPCVVKMLEDDNSTIWIKWGPYDCEFSDLPLRAMATIADNISDK